MNMEKMGAASGPSKKELERIEKEKIKELYGRSKEILDRVDFGTIKDILAGERSRAGIRKPDDFSCSLDKVGMQYIGGAAGGYMSDEKKVYLDPKIITELQLDENLELISPEKLDLENEILSTLIHEETHSASKNKGMVSTPPTQIVAFLLSYLKPIRLGASGYVTDARLEDGKMQVQHLHLFNEAVTDLIAQDVWKEYRTRTGNAAPEGESYRSNYFVAVAVLESFLEHVAQITGVPRDTVWNGIKQGYFSGLDLANKELAEAFDELAIAELVKRMEHMTYDDVPSLVSDMNIDSVPEDVRERIELGVKTMQKIFEKRKGEDVENSNAEIKKI